MAKKVSQFALKKTGGKGIRKALQDIGEKALVEQEKIAAPALHTKGVTPMVEKIFQHAEEQRQPDYPPATEPVFEPADPELTKQMVPQQSIAGQLPQVEPDVVAGIKGGRALQIHQNRDTLGRMLAQSILDVPEANLPFYSTGTVLAGLVDKGLLSPGQAQTFMRDWAGQGAATSPRTKTPPNLRNASYLQWRAAQGNPMSKPVWDAEKPFWQQEAGLSNRPGFPLIGQMHPALSYEFLTGTANPLENPKPFTFRENWSGNMADVTADTHNIRATLDALDRMAPGSLQREWFGSDAEYNAYRERGGFPQGSLEKEGIDDTLGSVQRNKVKSQLEYPILQGPTQEAARLLNIAPAEAQERLWFAKGPRTGLRSPPMTIPDLLNAQFEVTARVLGISPEEVMKLWAQRKIPLAENEEQQPVPGQTGVA